MQRKKERSNNLVISGLFRGNNDEYREIKRAISGDKKAFSNIIKRNKIYLYKMAYMYVKDEEKSLEIL